MAVPVEWEKRAILAIFPSGSIAMRTPILLLGLTLLLLAGCGHKGPLYLPPDQPSQEAR